MKFIFSPPALLNCKIDKTSRVLSRCDLTYVTVAKHSYVGHQSFAVNAEIGSFCSIGERCCIGGASHPVDFVSTSPAFLSRLNGTKSKFHKHECPPTPKTFIENDVWLGTGVFIKSGVTIHTGAVVGMGSVVTHDIGPYEIWAGNPAHKIRDRFDDETKANLLKSRWWEYDDKQLYKFAPYFNDPAAFLRQVSDSE